jgi:hypothetical protein
VYNFTGTRIDAKHFRLTFSKTMQVIEPGIDRTFTLALQDIIMNQTNINLVKVVGI